MSKRDHDLAPDARRAITTRRRTSAVIAALGHDGAGMTDTTTKAAGVCALAIRRVRRADIPDVIALDERVTGFAKPDYWHGQFARYGERRVGERFFLVAQASLDRCEGAEILGFIIGEVRAWEFGSPPCGWVFALSVRPGARLHGIGRMLLQAIATEFRKANVTKMRTMVARDNRLHLLFFRGEGMIAGPYIQLEKELD